MVRKEIFCQLLVSSVIGSFHLFDPQLFVTDEEFTLGQFFLKYQLLYGYILVLKDFIRWYWLNITVRHNTPTID